MKKLISIGEALIDFIPSKVNCEFKEVPSFERACGGAPSNVAAVYSLLGGKSEIITQLGNDGFGEYIIYTLKKAGVDTSHIMRTNKANTALAFVSLKDDGSREFTFYRKPSADMLLEPEQIEPEWFKDCGVLHFCSVDLIDAPVKKAHVKAIEEAKKAGAYISFDPNIRLPLWDGAEECKKTVREFLKYADILKISDEELEFITGETDINTASKKLFDGGAKAVLYSLGKEGSMLITPNFTVKAENYPVKAVDTTGAGDAVIGAFLFKLIESGKAIEEISSDEMQGLLKYANAYSNHSVCGHGAITSYGRADDIEEFIKKFN